MNRPARFLVGVGVLWIAPTLVLAKGGCVTDQNGKVVCGQPDSTAQRISAVRSFVQSPEAA